MQESWTYARKGPPSGQPIHSKSFENSNLCPTRFKPFNRNNLPSPHAPSLYSPTQYMLESVIFNVLHYHYHFCSGNYEEERTVIKLWHWPLRALKHTCRTPDKLYRSPLPQIVWRNPRRLRSYRRDPRISPTHVSPGSRLFKHLAWIYCCEDDASE